MSARHAKIVPRMRERSESRDPRSQEMLPSQGRLPGEKPMKINNMEMKEHPVSPVLLNHKAGALVSLIETVTMLHV